MNFIDISQDIYSGMPVYPNNPEVSLKAIASTISVISELTLGTHTGTHVDAPRHVFENGNDVSNINLDKFFGPCAVIDLTHVESEISTQDIVKGLDNLKSTDSGNLPDGAAVMSVIPHQTAKFPGKIIFKTRNSLSFYAGNEHPEGSAKSHPAKFSKDYVSLSGDAADFLAEKPGLHLVGIDYLSIKAVGSSDKRPHTSLLKKEVVIFEGLNLSNVVAGEYIFCGLPLKLKDADGAPARAVLIKH